MYLANIVELWSAVWLAGAVMLVMGAIFAIILLAASEKLKVEEDPKVAKVREALPGLDCGACGYAGCSSYARAVVENPGEIGKCAPGGSTTARKIAESLNLQISESGSPKRPIVHCRAHTKDKTWLATYQGVETCLGANTLTNAQSCKFGCLGFGDCVDVCRFDALHIVDGLATVDYEKCTGCGACAQACPRNLIEMVPFGQEKMMTVACSNKESGKVTKSQCKVGCIGCRLCTKQSELFVVKDNLARLDYQNYQPNEAAEAAKNKCPTGVIVYRGKGAESESPAEEKSGADTRQKRQAKNKA